MIIEHPNIILGLKLVEGCGNIVELVLTCEWDLNLLYFSVHWVEIVAKLNKLLLKVDHNRRQVP